MTTAPKRDESVVTLKHSSEAWADSTDRVPVFTVVDSEGNGTDYTMPRKPNAGIALGYLKAARKQGPDLAMSWLIETAVGEEGYDALVDDLAGYDGDPQLVLQSIVTKIQTISMGGLEAPKG